MHLKKNVATILLLPVLLFGFFLWLLQSPSMQAAEEVSTTQPLSNAGFECTAGYNAEADGVGGTYFVPADWKLVVITGTPVISSARAFFAGSCDGSAHVERLDGIDSIVLRSQDIETNPNPGKPFDVAFYQQVAVLSGTAYSLSGWMLSLCGGSAVPSDCPDDAYMAKMIGIDPTGGTDPEAASVVWAENRKNFVDNNNQRIGWQNLFVGAVAQNDTITLFARINSPFQHHGNHAFIDALSLVEAPTARLILPPSEPLSGTVLLPEVVAIKGDSVDVGWTGDLGPDIPAIAGGNYALLFDVEYRQMGESMWQRLATAHVGEGCRVLSISEADTVYELRVRSLADQIGEGVFPTQRYPGQWSAIQKVLFQPASHTAPVPSDDSFQLYLPYAAAFGTRECR